MHAARHTVRHVTHEETQQRNEAHATVTGPSAASEEEPRTGATRERKREKNKTNRQMAANRRANRQQTAHAAAATVATVAVWRTTTTRRRGGGGAEAKQMRKEHARPRSGGARGSVETKNGEQTREEIGGEWGEAGGGG